MDFFVKSKFSEEITFGLRNEPNSISKALSTSILVLLFFPSDVALSSLVSSVEFTGTVQEEAPKPTAMKRAPSGKSAPKRPVLVRSMSESIESKNSKSEKRGGSFFFHRSIGNFLVFSVMTTEDDDGFVAAAVTIGLECNDGQRCIVRFPIHPDVHVAIGAIYKIDHGCSLDDMYAESIALLGMLKESDLQLVGPSSILIHLSEEDLLWLHGIMVSFVRDAAGSVGMRAATTAVLTSLSNSFKRSILSKYPYFSLGAVGHVVEMLPGVVAAHSTVPHAFQLWKIPYAVLQSGVPDDTQYALRNKLEVRRALRYLQSEDTADFNPCRSYASLSGTMPLMMGIQLKSPSIRYPPCGDGGLQMWCKDVISQSEQLLSVLKEQRFDKVVRAMQGFDVSDYGKLLTVFDQKLKFAAESYLIWSRAMEAMGSRHSATESEDQILAEINADLYGSGGRVDSVHYNEQFTSLTLRFREALTTCRVAKFLDDSQATDPIDGADEQYPQNDKPYSSVMGVQVCAHIEAALLHFNEGLCTAQHMFGATADLQDVHRETLLSFLATIEEAVAVRSEGSGLLSLSDAMTIHRCVEVGDSATLAHGLIGPYPSYVTTLDNNKSQDDSPTSVSTNGGGGIGIRGAKTAFVQALELDQPGVLAIVKLPSQATMSCTGAVMLDGNCVRTVRDVPGGASGTDAGSAEYAYRGSSIHTEGACHVVAGAVASGRMTMTGPRLSAKFYNPRGICVLASNDDDADGRGSSSPQLIVIADTGNHCLRSLTMTKEGAFTNTIETIAGVGVAGHSDGPAKKAYLNSPTGLASVGSCIIVCDTGNNLLRCLNTGKRLLSRSTTAIDSQHQNRHMEGMYTEERTLIDAPSRLFTIAGVVDRTGEDDGPVAVATLNEPCAVCIWKGLIYFVEKGPRPSIRQLSDCIDEGGPTPTAVLEAPLGNITTLHRGEPLMAPSCICAVSDVILLICDPGAHCVWSFDVSTRELTTKISNETFARFYSAIVDDMPVSQVHSPHATGEASDQQQDRFGHSLRYYSKKQELKGSKGSTAISTPLKRFCPISIAVFSPGCYIFTELHSKSTMFKFFDAEYIASQQELTAASHSALRAMEHRLYETTLAYHAQVETTTAAISSAAALGYKLKCKVLESSFRNEISNLQRLPRSILFEGSFVPISMLMSVLRSAPTLRACVAAVELTFDKLAQQALILNQVDRSTTLLVNGAPTARDDLVKLHTAECDELDSFLVKKFTNMEFGALHVDAHGEVAAAADILRLIPSHQLAILALRAILLNERFLMPVDSSTLALISIPSSHYKPEDADPRRVETGFRSAASGGGTGGDGKLIQNTNSAVLAWLRRLLPLPRKIEAAAYNKHFQSAVEFWVTNRMSFAEECINVATWDNLVVLHLESLVAGSALVGYEITTTELGTVTKSEITVPRVHCYLQYLPELCSQSERVGDRMLQLLVRVAVKCIHILRGDPESAILLLLQGIEAMQERSAVSEMYSDGHNNGISDGKSAGVHPYTVVFQQLLLELVSTAYREIEAAEKSTDREIRGPVAQDSSTTTIAAVSAPPTATVQGISDSIGSENDENIDHAEDSTGVLSAMQDSTSEQHKVEVRVDELTQSVELPHTSEYSPGYQTRSDWEVQFLLLKEHPELWVHFLEWGLSPFFEQSRVATQFTPQLNSLHSKLQQHFRTLSLCVLRGHVTVEDLHRAHNNHDNLCVVWQLLGSPLQDESILSSMQAEILGCRSEIKVMISVLSSLMPEANQLKLLMDVDHSFEAQYVGAVKSLLRLHHEGYDEMDGRALSHFTEECILSVFHVSPLPELLCRALDWLVFVSKSEFFKQFWKENVRCDNVSDNAVDSIESVAQLWNETFRKALDKSLDFEFLERFSDLLLLEVTQFVQSASSLQVQASQLLPPQTSHSIDFPTVVEAIDMQGKGMLQSAVEQIRITVHRWRRTRALHVHRELVHQILEASRSHIATSSHEKISSLQATLRSLCQRIDDNGLWAHQQIRLVDSAYWDFASTIDHRITAIPHLLLVSMDANKRLLEWLRVVKDDEAFSSSIEMARSLQEINAPPELWDALAGRVSERYLSMITNVRSYLHPYLYSGDQAIDSLELEPFVEIFSSLNSKIDHAVIVANLDECGSVSEQLSQLICSNSSTVGSSRLARLYNIASGSVWLCSKSRSSEAIYAAAASADDDVSISLRYQVGDTAAAHKSWSQFSSNDLYDFQSNLVLERANAPDDEADDSRIVNTFLQQFSWVRRLSVVLLQLHTAGHFCYFPAFHCELPVYLPSDAFRKKVAESEDTLSDWVSHVNHIRRTYYFVNYLDLKRCFDLVEILRASTTAVGIEALAPFLYFINADFAYDTERMRSFTDTLSSTWAGLTMKAGDTATSGSHDGAKQSLEIVAKCIEVTFRSIPVRLRLLHLNDDEVDRSLGERMARGVHVVIQQSLQGQHPRALYDQFLTLSATHGYFPEWESALICDKSTTTEQIVMLLHRWSRSRTACEGRDKTVYALVEVDLLSYDCQNIAVKMIRDLAPSTANCAPLVLYAETAENCHLISQFQHNRIICDVLSPSALREVSSQLQSHNYEASCFASASAGAGKSFRIRQQAAQAGLAYAHVAINSTHTPIKTLISRIEESIHRSHEVDVGLSHHDALTVVAGGKVGGGAGPHRRAGSLLHFDIASTANPSTLRSLFGLCVLGIIADNESNAVYCWPAAPTTIALELAAGLQNTAFAQLSWLRTENCSASQDSFAVDSTALRMGMRSEFDASLFGDFTSAEKAGGGRDSGSDNGRNAAVSTASRRQVNAYERLIYVAKILHIRDCCSGALPDSLPAVPIPKPAPPQRHPKSDKAATEITQSSQSQHVVVGAAATCISSSSTAPASLAGQRQHLTPPPPPPPPTPSPPPPTPPVRGRVSASDTSLQQQREPWNCPACTFFNEMGDDLCSMCDTLRTAPSVFAASPARAAEAAEADMPLSTSTGRAEGSGASVNWLDQQQISCPACTFVNPATATRCRICDSYMSQESAPVTSAVAQPPNRGMAGGSSTAASVRAGPYNPNKCCVCQQWFISSDLRLPQGDDRFAHDRCSARVVGTVGTHNPNKCMYCNKWFLSSDTKVPQGDSGFSHERCGPRVGGGREAEQVLIASETADPSKCAYCGKGFGLLWDRKRAIGGGLSAHGKCIRQQAEAAAVAPLPQLVPQSPPSPTHPTVRAPPPQVQAAAPAPPTPYACIHCGKGFDFFINRKVSQGNGSFAHSTCVAPPTSTGGDRLSFELDPPLQTSREGSTLDAASEVDNVPILDSMGDRKMGATGVDCTAITKSEFCFDGVTLDQHRIFYLLKKASGLQGASPSLWSLWAFINVLYWQLNEIQHPESPIALACLADTDIKLMSLEFDMAMKARIKGELVNFIINTAREFATRPSAAPADPERLVGIVVRNLSFIRESAGEDMKNLVWKREKFDNDGQPVFFSPEFYYQVVQSHYQNFYYLYYRSSENRWVIDDSVNYMGAVFAHSLDNRPLDETQFVRTLQSGKAGVAVRVDLCTHVDPRAHNNEAVRVSGFQVCPAGSSASNGDNGLYLRLPPSEDLEGKPHYFKDDGENSRHLCFAVIHKDSCRFRRDIEADRALCRCSEKYWAIAKTCNVPAMGCTASSSNRNISVSSWNYVAPPLPEEGLRIEYIRASDAAAQMYSLLPRATVDEAAAQADEEFGIKLPQWKDSNHECVFFNNSTGFVSFLGINAQKLRENMHPVLMKHLVTNEINVGEDLDRIDVKHWDILAGLTGVVRSPQETAKLMDGTFCLTGDTLLKMLAIVCRIRCKIPVVLLGECGCGKTMLISFLCKWLNVRLLSLDVHGGTSEADIVATFARAQALLDEPGAAQTVFVFLDEVNTCAHMGLLNEAICHRTLHGRRLGDGIQILAALNPYRLRRQRVEMGLTFALGRNPGDDPMSQLVYRVNPIPPTLKDFLFDFGSLEPPTELLYIESMVSNDPHINRILGTQPLERERETISLLIHTCQSFVREVEGDPSVVSLRDVKRCLSLLRWFHDDLPDDQLQSLSSVSRAAILAMAHVYWYRLSDANDRLRFMAHISVTIQRKGARSGFVSLGQGGSASLLTVVARAQSLFSENLDVEDGVSMNQALSENLFVSIVCILNRIPIFIVGKPGTSKTLAIQVIASNLQGPQSPRKYWRTMPAVHIFQYQCSPMSTTQSIHQMFEAAKSYQAHSSDVLTVLLLDEVGLAENSPDKPLKVLHYILVEPPIAIVGLSNWTLDSSKMNRAICLQRPEPSEADITLTGRNIVAGPRPQLLSSSDDTGGGGGGDFMSSLSSALGIRSGLRRELSRSSSGQSWLAPLAKAYLNLYTNQRQLLASERDFYGMRDYYALLKQLRVEINSRGELTPQILASAVCRNFGGRPRAMAKILGLFSDACFPVVEQADGGEGAGQVVRRGSPRTSASPASTPRTSASPASTPRTRTRSGMILEPVGVLGLIHENMSSKDSRHLMIMSYNETIVHVLFGCDIVDNSSVCVLVGSRFKEDLEDLHLIQQINKVKNAMAEGKVVMLVNNESIYEALYDVLNQRYVRQRDAQTGETRLLLRLAMGSRSQLCPVATGFKLIVVVGIEAAYNRLDLPLLNRFEKQVISPADVLDTGGPGHAIQAQLLQWAHHVESETGLSLARVFCGYYEGTIPSLVLTLTEFGKSTHDWTPATVQNVVERGKVFLLFTAMPAALIHSATLKATVNTHFSIGAEDRSTAVDSYLESRSHLMAFLESELIEKHPKSSSISESKSSKSSKSSSSVESKLLLITTRAPIHHFDTSVKNWLSNAHTREPKSHLHQSGWIHSMADTDIQTVHLAHIGSESALTNVVTRFYDNCSASGPKLLTVLCDPIFSDISLISHAQYLVAQLHHDYCMRTNTQQQTLPPDAAVSEVDYSTSRRPRHVVFIVHLPSGVTSRTRDFPLDMYPPWQFHYLDDLISPVDLGGPALMKLVTSSIYDLCKDPDAGLVDLRMVMTKNFQSALAQCLPPVLAYSLTPSDADIVSPSRVRVMQDLLRRPGFEEYVRSCVLHCLKEVRCLANGMQLHVHQACESDSGSLRQSLLRSIANIVVRAFGYVLRTIDTNFNILWLFQHIQYQPDALSVWVRLAEIVHSPDRVGSLVPDLSSKAGDGVAPSTGKFGAFACAFPFSEKLVDVLEDKNAGARGNLELLAADDLNVLRASLNSVINANFDGALMNAIYSAVLTANPTAYMHDFVHLTAYPFQHVEFVDHLAIIQSMISALGSTLESHDHPYTPASIHSSYWIIEARVFHVLSSLSSISTAALMSRSNLFVAMDARSVVQTLKGVTADGAASLGGGEGPRETTTQSLRRIDTALCGLLLDTLKHSLDSILATQGDRDAHRAWMHLFSALQPDVEAFLIMALQNPQNKELHGSQSSLFSAGDSNTELAVRWWLVRAARVVLGEYNNTGDNIAGTQTPTSAAEAREQAAVFRSLQAVSRIDPRSAAHLQQFSLACQYEVDPARRFSVICSYLTKFLMPAIELISSWSGEPMALAPDMIAQIAELAVLDTSEYHRVSESHLSMSSPLHAPTAGIGGSLSLCGTIKIEQQGHRALSRACVDELYGCLSRGQQDVVERALQAILVKDCSVGFFLMQLLCERCEDQAGNIALKGGFSIAAGTPVDPSASVASITALLASTTAAEMIAHINRIGIVHTLHALAAARHALHEYCAAIYANLRSRSALPPVPAQLSGLISSSGEISLIALNHIVRMGGKSALLEYFRSEGIPVRPEGVQCMDSARDAKPTDFFTLLQGQSLACFDDINSAVQRSLYANSVTALDQISLTRFGAAARRSVDEFWPALLSAVFSQVNGGMRIEAGMECMITDWARRFLATQRQSDGGRKAKAYVDILRHAFVSTTLKMSSDNELSHSHQRLLQYHIIAVVLESPTSWLWKLLFHPKSLQQALLPSMQDSEFFSILTSDTSLGWYQCPNGHHYSVGNCSWPMEEAKCPVEGCGAKIGGQNHTAVEGVKRLGKGSEIAKDNSVTNPGYLLESTLDPASYLLGRLGPVPLVFVRYVMHSIMLYAAHVCPVYTPEMREGGVSSFQSLVAELMYPSTQTAALPSPSRIQAELAVRLQRDWERLSSLVEMEADDMAAGLHNCLQRLVHVAQHCGRGDNNTFELRREFEVRVAQEVTNPVFAVAMSKDILRGQRERLQHQNLDAKLKDCLGSLFYEVMGLGVPPQPLGALRMTLLRPREVITLHRFQIYFGLRSSDHARFPILSSVLKHVKGLALIAYIADILAWQRIVFKALRPGSVSRDGAREIRNIDVIEGNGMLPGLAVGEREKAHTVLEKYCTAFNETISLPGYLRECADNIFLAPDGSVDLMCSQGRSPPIGMSPQASVMFALPNTLKSGNDFLDPRNLCTVFILEQLQAIQDDVVKSLLQGASGPAERVTAVTGGGGGGGGGEAVTPIAGVRQERTRDIEYSDPDPEAASLRVPVTTLWTPHAVVKRRLLYFDVDRHLMKSIVVHALQHFEYGQGDLHGFNLEAVEADLRDALLPSAQPFALAVREFRFSGELAVSGALSRLSQIVRQEDLSETVLQQIWEEIDTRDRLALLNAQIDDCIAFITSSSGSGSWQSSGETTLSSYILETLLIDPDLWADIACPSLMSSVCIRHIRSLKDGLYEKEHGGDAFFDLPDEYRSSDIDSLSDKHRDELARVASAAGPVALRDLLGAIKSFLFLLKDSSNKFTPDVFSNLQIVDDDLFVLEWYVGAFPRDLMIEQTLAAFQYLSSR